METIALIPEAQLARTEFRQRAACPELWALLDEVKDPEIPVLSLWDLGILQDVSRQGETVKVVITPTYCGCPAMAEIERDIRTTLARAGYDSVAVQLRLSPAWSSDWLSAEGRKRLQAYGIAPPLAAAANRVVKCPQCGAENTAPISEFGSTACKALYKCNECLEPFDYFKSI